MKNQTVPHRLFSFYFVTILCNHNSTANAVFMLKTVDKWQSLCYNECNDYNEIIVTIFEVKYRCQL